MSENAALEVILLAGVPFGAPLMEQAARRLRQLGWSAEALDLPSLGADPRQWPEALSARLGAGATLMAAGSAVPVALAAAAAREAAGRPLGGLALLNGALGRVDPALALAARVARRGPLGRLALRPSLLLPVLASSFGLRRAVVNPYVMERDRVVVVTEAWLGEGRDLGLLQRHLAEIDLQVDVPAIASTPVVLLWGDADPLYPPAVAEAARAQLGPALHLRIAGGQHLHIEERPWAAADALDAWARGERGAGVPQGLSNKR